MAFKIFSAVTPCNLSQYYMLAFVSHHSGKDIKPALPILSPLSSLRLPQLEPSCQKLGTAHTAHTHTTRPDEETRTASDPS